MNIMVVLVALLFNLFDFLTGIIGALRTEDKLNSTKMRDGLFKKGGFICMYALGYLIMFAGKYIDLPFEVNLVPIICAWAILTEIVSIIENICKINPDFLPDALKKLIGFKTEGGENENAIQGRNL